MARAMVAGRIRAASQPMPCRNLGRHYSNGGLRERCHALSSTPFGGRELRKNAALLMGFALRFRRENLMWESVPLHFLHFLSFHFIAFEDFAKSFREQGPNDICGLGPLVVGLASICQKL